MAEASVAVELRGLTPDVPDELLTLYFENRRRSGGGPVRSWRRLGCGGVLTFQEPADAARVLAQGEHVLHQVRLSLRPAPPRAPGRLLLQGLPPGAAAPRLEQHVRALLRAAGLPEQSCRVLASLRPDCALVQLPSPLSEAEIGVLEEQAGALGLEGSAVTVAPMPQARAVRVVGCTPPPDLLLLELYLENQPRSGGGPLEGLRSLPGTLGTVVTFQQWQAAERVLQRDHWVQDSKLHLVPHYDILEPQELPENSAEGDCPGQPCPEASEHILLEPGGQTTAPEGPRTGAETDCVGAPGPSEGTWSLGWGSPEQDGPGTLGPVGSPEQDGPGTQGPVGSAGQGAVAEAVLSMDPGALRFLQLHHEDLLTSLGDVALFPLEGSDVTGFRLCGALAPCQAAEEFLRSLLGSISCHTLSLRHPGTASFLLSPEGQCLLQRLEAQFQCVLGTERLARAALDTGPEEVDPTEALQTHVPLAPDPAGSDQKNMSLEEVRKLLATLEGLDGEEKRPEGEPSPEEKEATSSECSGEEPAAPTTGGPGQLEEEAALQLALHRSLEPRSTEGEQEEAAALQRALALSLLEQLPLEAGGPPGSGAGGVAQLVVHSAFEQDVEELNQALEAALEEYLREETVDMRGRVLPVELRARLEKCHGVRIGLQGDCAVLRGFGAQPARAARHFAALMAGPQDQSQAFPLVASCPSSPQLRLKSPSGDALESLAESSDEFQDVVQAFYDTLDATHSRISIVRVERVSHPLLQRQYDLHRERLEQRCERRPAEQVLYHGTSAAAVRDICAHGFNRSFCGRNGTLYGQGVYFAKRASLSVQDRYSPPDANGNKAVFVARVLTGDYGQGHPELRAPPQRASGHHLLRYDSAVDSLHQPSIFVIFHDTQALPTHLITCKHVLRASPGDSSGFQGHSPTS